MKQFALSLFELTFADWNVGICNSSFDSYWWFNSFSIPGENHWGCIRRWDLRNKRTAGVSNWIHTPPNATMGATFIYMFIEIDHWNQNLAVFALKVTSRGWFLWFLRWMTISIGHWWDGTSGMDFWQCCWYLRVMVEYFYRENDHNTIQNCKERVFHKVRRNNKTNTILATLHFT